jgi:AcrR family transcriptional regulator
VPSAVRPAERPRHQARATRAGGVRTRTALLDAASALFVERGLGAVSVADIAAAADAFPSQVTYYFGSKEALFVEAASREVLHLAARVEAAGSAPLADRAEYARVMAREALASAALLAFAEALLLARKREDLEPLVARTLARLHAEGARAVAARCAASGWTLNAPPAALASAFWATCLGLVLEREGTGGTLDMETAEAAVLAAISMAHPRGAEPNVLED